MIKNVLKKTVQAVAVVVGIYVVCLFAQLLIQTIRIPVCGWRWLTGGPCPFCGSTRCLAALGRLDVLHAFLFNPFVFLATIGATLWGIWGHSREFFKAWPWFKIMIVMVGIHWIYMIWASRVGIV